MAETNKPALVNEPVDLELNLNEQQLRRLNSILLEQETLKAQLNLIVASYADSAGLEPKGSFKFEAQARKIIFNG